MAGGFNVAEELSDAFVHIWHTQPAFMGIIQCAPLIVRIDDSIPTAGVYDRRIGFNSEFLKTLTYVEAAGVLLHEVLHYLQGHCELLYRWREIKAITGELKIGGMVVTRPFDELVAQHCFDCVVNDALKRNGIPLPDPHIHMPHVGGWFDAEHDTYVNLYDLYQSQGKLDPPPKLPGSNSGPPQPGQGQGKPGQNGPAMDVQPHDPDAVTGDPQRKGEVVRKALVDLMTQAGRGFNSGDIERLIDRLVPKRFPWQEIIKPRFQSLFGRRKPTWTRLDRGALAVRQVMPGHVGTKAGKVMQVLDTSGSIDRIQQEHFVSNSMYMMEDCRPKELVVLEIDTFVRRESRFTNIYEMRRFIEPMVEPHEKRRTGLYGGGGTDMCAAWTWIKENDWVPDIMCVLTDGYTEFPEGMDPVKEVYWIMTTDVVAPEQAGQTARMWLD